MTKALVYDTSQGDVIATSSKGLVYIQGPHYYEYTKDVFEEYGYTVTKNIFESDIVVLTGGEDINPAIYGEMPTDTHYFSERRDQIDLKAAEIGFKNGKFLAGICRGAQMYNCYPNGGKLVQHVDNHAGGSHLVKDFVDGNKYKVLSIHHQQMIPTEDAVVVAGANLNSDDWKDIEVLWYPNTRSLCFQSHPEFGDLSTARYFFNVLMQRYYHNDNRVSS